ncbi:MAG: hypothetical protein JO353_02665 [Phycisphaerae bacterium]|nr:hypothetical protein [Phycisphaerae bacterium]
MKVRELLRQRPWIGIAVCFGAVLIAAASVWATLRSSEPAMPLMPASVFFSDDDGKTYFADDSARISGFDHAGKTAYQAAVFQCGHGSPFVGYLIKFNASGKSALEQIPDAERRANSSQAWGIRQTSSLIKRPSDKSWISLDGAAAANQVLNPPCPDNSSDTPHQILP